MHVDDVYVLNTLLHDAEAEQYDTNRRAARRCEALADVLRFAGENPATYVRADVDADDPLGLRVDRAMRKATARLGGPAALAVRCAADEAASRLGLSEHQVRTLAATADRAKEQLPRAWHAAREGLLTIAHVDAMLAQVAALTDYPDLLALFDRVMTEVALHASAAYTKRKARDLTDQLTARTRTQRHTDAFAKRTLYVDDVADGMSWLCLLMPTRTAHAVDHSVTATAKGMTEAERDGRTHAQIRADLATALLTGEATGDPIVKTKVFVTVPLDKLAPDARATARTGTPGSSEPDSDERVGDRPVGAGPVRTGLNLNRDCLIPGQGTIDDATARQILIDVGAFTRVITDPVTGIILDMDRRSRAATPGQRAWLALAHGTCLRDGCDRLAVDGDIDHHCAYHGPGRGATNLGNLDPLCDPDHTLKDVTLLTHDRRADGTVQVRYPTGYCTTDPNDAFRTILYATFGYTEPPPRLTADSAELGADPPF